jgi:ABC-type Fe3+ transport system permease subunit
VNALAMLQRLNAGLTLQDRPKTGAFRGFVVRGWESRTKYLAGAICIALCAIMLAPLVLSVMASLKSTVEAAAIPPTYFPHQLSLDSYAKLWRYQDGLPTYLLNSGATAVLAIAFSLALTIPAGYALARFPVPGKEYLFIFLLLALIIPYQALITPTFFMFAQLRLTNTVVGLAIIHTAVTFPSASTSCATVSRRCRKSWRRRRSSTAATAGRPSSGSTFRRSGRRSSPSRSSLSSRHGTSSSRRSSS